ncbi:MAG: SbtA family thio(seleno)oxazole RiPP natural product precursor [bacterium]|nr:selenobiotic family radical SAM modification target peptide [bacterium]
MDSLDFKKFLAGLSIVGLIGAGGAALTGCTNSGSG